MEELIIPIKVRLYTDSSLPATLAALCDEARAAASAAYAPYSKFHVGAAVLLDNGIMVSGNNQENVAYPSGLCAERVALFYAGAQHPGIGVQAIAIAAKHADGEAVDFISPCGACRQVMAETQTRSGHAMQVVLCGTERVYVIDDAASLLPFAFDEAQMGNQRT
jgi:cytidine deaminase